MAQPPITHLLYLHGFRSSPQSTKARRMAQCMQDWPQVRWVCPQLPESPRAVARLLQGLTQDVPVDTMAVMGSSLGGFYATWLAEHLGCRAVLINPAVRPERDLQPWVGRRPSWHQPDNWIEVRPEHVEQMAELDVGGIRHPDRFLVYIAQGDEVLDWREMAARYPVPGARILPGGDHALSDFERHLPEILRFLGLLHTT
ncbi:MAG: YqiA/YcfP family alpha/beta fold hydrolase [Alphaproteobacteria bacterium]|nr:YqiA/YcfP family alpha/beta fold hydrolase [Alphaproteobacteria bacterium]